MKAILAIDSFKGCLTSAEAEEAAAAALAERGVDSLQLPMSDGGDGMLEAFTRAMHGRTVEVRVLDPLMRPITARYGIAPDGTAIVETAQACGLHLVRPEERRPLVATTYGVGELIAHALDAGCRRFIVGLGGSGTSDCGRGMLQALVRIMAKGETIDSVLEKQAIRESRFILASDVRNPLYGAEGAAAVFGPQKGATPEAVETLDRRARLFAEMSARHCGHDCSQQPGAGAAGGLGYAFMQYFGAEVASGADLLLDLLDFDSLLAEAAVVITGEGHADRQTLMGKLPERVLRRAARRGVPTLLVAGRIDDRDALLRAGFCRVESITPDGMTAEEAVSPDTARANLRRCLMSTPLLNNAKA